VTKKKCDGKVKDVDPTFLRLLDRYCSRVFDKKNLAPKIINGRELTAIELNTYIETYAKMFSDGATFPKASTMLEATTDASNKNATDISIRQYKEKMDEIAGASCTGYLKREECEKSSRDCSSRALASFDEVATFGNEKKIQKTKEKLRRDIQELEEMYQKFNSSRNPFEGMETIMVPFVIGVASYILRKVADTSCTSWSDTCCAGSNVLSEVQIVVFIFLGIVSMTKAKQFRVLFNNMMALYRTLVPAAVPATPVKQD